MIILVATRDEVLRLDPAEGALRPTTGVEPGPTCLAADRTGPGRAWCGTEEGVYRSEDEGRTWRPSGLEDEKITALAADPARPGEAWAGTEPSAVFRTDEGGRAWNRIEGLMELPSAPEWSFPPRPETHHVRWMEPRPRDPGRLWLAIEAGALVTLDISPGRDPSWRDRVPGGPYDTHEIAVHPERPETLRVAAGDGYYESDDGGSSWHSPEEGLEAGYLRSVAVDPGDPDLIVISAASGAKSAYQAGFADGRLYRRRAGNSSWARVTDGWPEEPETIAPLLTAGSEAGKLWAADERGLHRSTDGGSSWERVTVFDPTPAWLRGLALVESR